jgi:hypothetical protein
LTADAAFLVDYHDVVFFNFFYLHNNLTTKSLNSNKPEITNHKQQITNRFQIYNSQISNKIELELFGILKLGHCDLFGICDLLFEFFLCLM